MAPVYDNELTTCNLTKKEGPFYECEVLHIHLFELIPQCGNVMIFHPLRIYVKLIENCHFYLELLRLNSPKQISRKKVSVAEKFINIHTLLSKYKIQFLFQSIIQIFSRSSADIFYIVRANRSPKVFPRYFRDETFSLTLTYSLRLQHPSTQ